MTLFTLEKPCQKSVGLYSKASSLLLPTGLVALWLLISELVCFYCHFFLVMKRQRMIFINLNDFYCQFVLTLFESIIPRPKFNGYVIINLVVFYPPKKKNHPCRLVVVNGNPLLSQKEIYKQ